MAPISMCSFSLPFLETKHPKSVSFSFNAERRNMEEIRMVVAIIPLNCPPEYKGENPILT